MMQWQIQQAIFARLEAELDTPVYDHVPQGSAYPYINIGEDTALQWDTDDSTGSESTLTIHTWSRQYGRRETKQIMRQIYNALHRAELDIAGGLFVTCEWEFAESFVDPDGVTRHGVMRFRILSEIDPQAVTFGGEPVTFSGEGVTYA